MSIYITGDTHTPIDTGKLSTRNWPKQKALTREDYLIVCGDFGAVWGGDKEDAYWQKWFNEKPFTTLFVDGNHENHRLLSAYPVEMWNGGKIHRIQPNVIHLMRGQVFSVDGVSIFAMGGARSTDQMFRTEGISWWPEELPSTEEYAEAHRNLEKVLWDVDLVITHCAPNLIQSKLADWYERDELTGFLDVVVRRHLTYQHWYFGHYHKDLDVDAQHTAIYERIVRYS